MNLFRSTLFATAFFAAFANHLQAAGNPPELVSYQGYLVDANGVPLGTDGLGNPDPANYDVIFRIYSASSGGDILWAEQQTITIDAGYFSVLLGEGTPNDSEPTGPLSEVFSGIGSDERFIGVAVRFEAGGGLTEILPRLRLLTSPYAFTAAQARSVIGPDGTALITAEGEQVTVAGDVVAQNLVGSGAGLTDINAANVTAGVLSSNQVPNLDASKITSGTLNQARLPASIGGNKTFTGSVGIGTSPSRPLHVGGGTTVLGRFDGSNAAGSWLSLGNSTTGGRYWQFISTGSGNGEGPGKLLIGSGFADGSTAVSMTVQPNGFVGLGTSSPLAPLDVRGSGSSSRTFNYYARGTTTLPVQSGFGGWVNVPGHIGAASGTVPYSILAQSRVGAAEFNAFSDERIKNVLGPSDPQANTDIIRRLRVTEYLPVDTIGEGAVRKTGFLAQEVGEILPGAVSLSERFVPDVYALPEAFEHDAVASRLTVKMAEAHHLNEGDRVRIFADADTLELPVVAVASPVTFTLGDCASEPARMFVYGREVADFHILNYDQIFTTGISAIQELLREVDTLNSRMEELERQQDRINAMDRELAQLRAVVKAMAGDHQLERATIELRSGAGGERLSSREEM